jgi:hypothetical protein
MDAGERSPAWEGGIEFPAMPVDTKTRFQGVFARHSRRCAIENGRRCNCKPSYYGVSYDRARKKPVKTKRMPTIDATRNARADLEQMLARGETPAPSTAIRLRDARERFVLAAREGRALNKHGRRFKPTAISNIEVSLRLHVEPTLGNRRLSDVRRGDVQNRCRRTRAQAVRKSHSQRRERDALALSMGARP